MLDELILTNFRCFQNQRIPLLPGINLIVGNNGSGKTSVIEAIYLAGRGRSFKTNFLSDLILKEQDTSVIFISGSNNNLPLRIGCQIQKSKLSIKVNTRSITKRSLLLDFLPLQIITPTSHELIDSGPSYRRKFIDWGLFHVEQLYRQNWSLFKRVLKQRNQLLKKGLSGLNNWDIEFVKYSMILDEYRKDYFNELRVLFNQTQSQLLGREVCDIAYYAGWNRNNGLQSELDINNKRDFISGWTSTGPHKADLKFIFDDKKRNVLSRGQQKMLVFSLQIAQCLHLKTKINQSPLLLIDDISSELDSTHLNRLLEFIDDIKLQSIVSLINKEQIDSQYIASVFHVEHVDNKNK